MLNYLLLVLAHNFTTCPSVPVSKTSLLVILNRASGIKSVVIHHRRLQVWLSKASPRAICIIHHFIRGEHTLAKVTSIFKNTKSSVLLLNASWTCLQYTSWRQYHAVSSTEATWCFTLWNCLFQLFCKLYRAK